MFGFARTRFHSGTCKAKKATNDYCRSNFSFTEKYRLLSQYSHGSFRRRCCSLRTSKKIETKPNTIAINAAFGQFSGLAGLAFPYFAKIAASTSIPARFLNKLANKEEIVRKILNSTGSIIPEMQIKCYQYLFSNHDHVDGTLQLMADWDLGKFLDRLPSEMSPIHFLVGEKDKTVPPHISKSWDQLMPNSSLTNLTN